MNKVSMILPVESFLILKDEKISVDMFRMKKNHLKKNFKIQLFNTGKVVKEYEFYKMTIKIKDSNSIVIFDITDGKDNIIVESRKFLESKELKKYIRTMII